MNLHQLQEVLRSATPYSQPRQELSIFDTAGRGYFENPATDLLAFFTDPTQPHGLADCFVSGILECVPEGHTFSPHPSQRPETEVVTGLGNRIDLLLKSDEWIIAIEHKIHHSINNPFDDYESHIRNTLDNVDQKPYFILLSPSGVFPADGWISLRHKDFIESVRRDLGVRMVEQEPNKWHTLAREFLLHLDNTVSEQSMDDEAFQFFIRNAHSIDEILKIKEDAIVTIQKKIGSRITEDFPEGALTMRRHSWSRGPALRYALRTWGSESDLVVSLTSTDSGISARVTVYCANSEGRLVELIKNEFGHLPSPTRTWHEKACFCMRWELGDFDEVRVLDLAAQCMQRLNAVETVVRSKL